MSIQTVESMATWIERNITNSPTLKGMSAHVGYSSFYCSAKFKEHIGITYKQYVAECRLKLALRDIVGTDDSILDIAYRCGYSSPESLSRACKTAYQQSPLQLRKKRLQATTPSEKHAPPD